MDVLGGGLYWTHYGAHGSYLDLTAQALHYRNRYRDQLGMSGDQSGWGGTVSAEVGRMFELAAKGWRLEPQLQLGYQHQDATEGEKDGLRGNVGFRMAF
jgi:outer membrane autotransporter protein